MNDLEPRCLKFARDTRDFCRTLEKDVINTVYIRQLIRSSSSIGANYIEANENLGKQDLLMRLKISRKEAKESIFWLNLLIAVDETKVNNLKGEAEELRKIFSAIINKIKGNE